MKNDSQDLDGEFGSVPFSYKSDFYLLNEHNLSIMEHALFTSYGHYLGKLYIPTSSVKVSRVFWSIENSGFVIESRETIIGRSYVQSAVSTSFPCPDAVDRELLAIRIESGPGFFFLPQNDICVESRAPRVGSPRIIPD